MSLKVIETAYTSTDLSSSISADAIDNSSMISSGTMNAKLPLWTAFLQFLPVKVLVCVYIDLAFPKSPSLQTVGFLPNTISSYLCLKLL